MSVQGLGSGRVFRRGNDPTALACSSKVGSFVVTITGYFVKGDRRTAGSRFQG